MSENTNEREQFEAWAYSALNPELKKMTLRKSKNCRYVSAYTQSKWEGWQAAIAHSQTISPTETFQLHEIFGSYEECPPIAETDSFIVKRVKEMAQLINSLSEKNESVADAYERCAQIIETTATSLDGEHKEFSINEESVHSVALHRLKTKAVKQIRALIKDGE